MTEKSNPSGDKRKDVNGNIIISNVPAEDGKKYDLTIQPGVNGEPGTVINKIEHTRPSSKRKPQ